MADWHTLYTQIVLLSLVIQLVPALDLFMSCQKQTLASMTTQQQQNCYSLAGCTNNGS